MIVNRALRSGYAWHLVWALSCVGFVIFVVDWAILHHSYFWDLKIYADAARLSRNGGNAYGQDFGGLWFVYSPLVLWVFERLGDSLLAIFLTAYLISAGVFFTLAPRHVTASLCLLFGVMIGHDFVIGPALTGNFSLFAHLLIFGLWVLPKSRTAFVALLVLISAVSVIKPYFAAYFLLWALREGKFTRHSLWALFALVAVVAVWGAQVLWAPERFADFLSALDRQTALGSSRQDMGEGIFRVVLYVVPSPLLALIIHGLLILVILGVWFMRLRPRLTNASDPRTEMLILTGAFIICVLMNPRLKVYDITLFYALCIHALYLRERTRSEFRGTALLGLTLFLAVLSLLAEIPGDSILAKFMIESLRYLAFLVSFVFAANMILQTPTSRPTPMAPET